MREDGHVVLACLCVEDELKALLGPGCEQPLHLQPGCTTRDGLCTSTSATHVDDNVQQVIC